MSHIRIDNIHKSFGPVEVLKGIDLELAQGSVLALLVHQVVARPPCCG